MKKRSMIFVMCACVLVLSLALGCVLAACGDKGGDDNGPFVPQQFEEEPALEIYSQRAHIGYKESVENVSQYKDYYAMGKPSFVIPGLNEGENFVLQGIAYSGEHNIALLAGYIKPATDNINSVIFVIDMAQYLKVDDDTYTQGVLIKEILLDKADGSAYTGHAGGISASKNNVWISNGGKLYYIPIADILAAPATSHIALKNSVNVPVNASYTEFSEGILWVGEFEYARDNYITDATHHSTADKKLTAWTVGYYIDETGKEGYDPATGIKNENLKDVAVPDIAFWHGEKVQGMTAIKMNDGNFKVLLSTSYGSVFDSKLRIYDVPVSSAAPQTVSVAGVSVPCYILSGGVSVTAPPMLEDLAHFTEGGKHYVLVACESGSFNYHGSETLKSFRPTDLIWRLEIEL